jgi:hypothetical protein
MRRTTAALVTAALVMAATGALSPTPAPRRLTRRAAAAETDGAPRRIILFDVMDTLVAVRANQPARRVHFILGDDAAAPAMSLGETTPSSRCHGEEVDA